MCEASEWVARAVTGLAGCLALGWPVAGLLAAALVLGVLVASVRQMGRLNAAEHAAWLEITPPAALPPSGAAGLWRMLAGCLRHAPGRRLLAPRPQLALEWWADPSGLRAGVWVAPSARPRRVADAITRAWPGTVVRPTHPPLWHRYPTRVLELAPAQGPWAPLIDPTTHPRPVEHPGDEPLRAVLAALAERAPGEQACAQLVVTTHPGRRGGRLGDGGAGMLRAAAPALLGTLAGALGAAVLAVLDLLTPGNSHTTRRSGGGRAGRDTGIDAVLSAARAAAAAKRAAGPHLRATLRVAVTVPMPSRWGHDRARAVDIATGYELITSELRLRWRRLRAAERITLRTHSPGAWVGTLAELAALWHLPAEPAAYHLSAPGVLRVPSRGNTTHLPGSHPTSRPEASEPTGRPGDRPPQVGGQRHLPPTTPPRPDTPRHRPGHPDSHNERRTPGATGWRGDTGHTRDTQPGAPPGIGCAATHPPRLARSRAVARLSRPPRPGRDLREGGEYR